ncbi:MAG: hypothetical protein NZ534_03975 [Bacteroidia bacterium]|nr:hypothetical protein [Bacteroidia bacterium]
MVVAQGVCVGFVASGCKPKPSDSPKPPPLTRTEMLAGFPEKRHSLVELRYQDRVIPASAAQAMNFLIFRNDGTGKHGNWPLEWAWLDSAETRLKMHVSTLDGVRRDTAAVERLTETELWLRYEYLYPPSGGRVAHPYIYVYRAY